jgi:hypothetical protein
MGLKFMEKTTLGLILIYLQEVIMTYKTKNNKLYFLNIVLLCALTYLLNIATAIYQCALVFTLIAINVNAITYLYGKAKALQGLSIAVFTGFVILWKLPYYIDGRIVNGLVTASFSSLMISMYWSASVFQILNNKFPISISIALSLIVGAIIDGLIMGLFFMMNNNLPYERVLDIFIRELFYKGLYGLVASIIIAITLNIINDPRRKQRGI